MQIKAIARWAAPIFSLNTSGKVLMAMAIFALFLAMSLPAYVATNTALRLVPESFRPMAIGPSGTIWNGHLSTLLIKQDQQLIHIEDLRWKLHWTALARGVLRASIEAKYLGQPAALIAELHISKRISLSNARFIGIPAQLLIARQQLPIPVHLGGKVNIAVKKLVWDQGIEHLEATINWKDSSIKVNESFIELGQLSAKLQTPQLGNLNIAFRDIKGPLKINGEFEHQGKLFKFQADAYPRKPLERNVRQALQVVSTPLQNGSGYRLSYSGKLSLPFLKQAAATP